MGWLLPIKQIVAIPYGGAPQYRNKKAFPFGEGGFFNDRREMKKTEEVLPQYGFAVG